MIHYNDLETRSSLQDGGFLESEHTADLALEVWAPSLSTLFVNAAKGMFAACGLQVIERGGHKNHTIRLHGEDNENLLVKFLSELLYLSERERAGFIEYQVNLADNTLQAIVTAVALQSIDKHIKAVTYHDLAIHNEEGMYRVRIVFDI
jgi:SHS2 domain-containing protein